MNPQENCPCCKGAVPPFSVFLCGRETTGSTRIWIMVTSYLSVSITLQYGEVISQLFFENDYIPLTVFYQSIFLGQ